MMPPTFPFSFMCKLTGGPDEPDDGFAVRRKRSRCGKSSPVVKRANVDGLRLDRHPGNVLRRSGGNCKEADGEKEYKVSGLHFLMSSHISQEYFGPGEQFVEHLEHDHEHQ